MDSFLFRVALVLLFLAAALKPPAQVPGGMAPELMISISSLDSSFTVQAPGYLVVTNDLDSSAAVQLKNILNETYTLIYEERTDSLGSIVLNSEILFIAQRLFESNILQAGGKILKQEYVRVDGFPAIQDEVEVVVDDVSLTYVVTFIGSADKLYKIYSWTLSDFFNQYRDDFCRIAASFQTKGHQL